MDEQVIDDLYKRAQSNGYTKSREEFVKLLHSDSDVFSDMYSYVKSKGYQKDENAFSALVGKTAISESEQVKKKAPSGSLQLLAGQKPSTESPLEDGSSDLQEKPKFQFNEMDFKQQMPRMAIDATFVKKPIDKIEMQKNLADAAKRKAENARLLNTQKIQDVQKQKEEDARIKANTLGVTQSPEFQQKLNIVNDKLIDQEEEEVVPKLNSEFGRYGFTFEETGAGDAMIVRSFDGKHTITIDLDPFTNATEVAESSKLRQFLNTYAQENFKINNEDFLSKAYKAQNLRNVGRLNDDGTESTVKMTSFEEDGKYYAIPTLFPKDPNNYNTNPSTWQELPFKEALKVARERGEMFQFRTNQEAKDFANGSWKDVSTRDIEADKFYKERGLDYITEKNRWEKYKELDDIIDFVEGNNDEGEAALKKTHPELFIKGKLRSDADQYIKNLKQQRDALEPLVKDYGFLSDGKSEVTRMDWDAQLAKREKQIASQAIQINNDAKIMQDELDAKSLQQFGIPAKDLLKYKNNDPNTKEEFEKLQQQYYVVQQTQKAAATKFEVAKTYFDGKADKQINGEFKENLRGFWNATSDAWKQGRIGEQLLSFSLPGGKNVSSFKDRKEAAEYIAKQYADMSNTEDRAMARWRNARGFTESAGVFLDDPAEMLTTMVSTSLSQILPYGWKIVGASTATGAGTGAVAGLSGGPFAEVTVPGGIIAGAGYGFRTGMAITNFAAEYTNALISAVEKQGYNPMDPVSLASALSDKKVWDEGRVVGLTRGIPISVVDYLSSGIAGRVFKPASALASTSSKIAHGVAERLIFDPLAEGAGELAAQTAEVGLGTGRKNIGWKEIAEESMGGLGSNTINWGFNTYKDIRNKNNVDIAHSLTQISNISSESASDEKITTWANNMLQLKKIDADVAQRINENVGLRKEARELLSVGTDKKPNTDVLNRTMELLSARNELSSTQNRREIYRSKIQAINEEIAAIGETKSLLPTDKSVDLSTIIGTTRQGTSQYSIDGRRFTKEQFIEKVNALPDEQLSRIILGVKNDPETSQIIKDRYDAIQKSKTDAGVLRTEESQLELQGMGEGNVQPQVATTGTKEVAHTQPKQEEIKLNTLNPTGSIFATYSAEHRDALPLGENMTTYDVTANISPNEKVTVYRGVPNDVNEIKSGDFVTTNKQLAQDYAGTDKVISMEVNASDILDDKTEPLGEEYILRIQQPEVSLKTGFEAEKQNNQTQSQTEEPKTFRSARELLKGYEKGTMINLIDLIKDLEAKDPLVAKILEKMKEKYNQIKISGKRENEGAAFYNYNTKQIDLNKNSTYWNDIEDHSLVGSLAHEFVHHLIDSSPNKESIENTLEEIKRDLISQNYNLTDKQKFIMKYMLSEKNSPQEILTYATDSKEVRALLASHMDKINQISNELFGEDVISQQDLEDSKSLTKNKNNEEVQSQRTGDGTGRNIGRKITPLEGTPSVPGFNGPDEQLIAVAEKYAADNGIDLKRQSEYVKVDEERARRISDAYEQMVHDPQNPKVKEAYQELIRQTVAQYQALVDAGYKFWFMDLNIPSNVEYAESPYNAMRDLRNNKTMGVFPTTDGFGTSDLDVSNNPLLEDTGIRWSVGSVDGETTMPVLANDLFRAVHDAFGHGLEGSGFRARGEENAWQAHVRLFTGPAVGAITSETRGQNSWLNFGPYGESNRTAKVEDTVFADQKTGLMPEWTWTEGRAGDMEATEQVAETTSNIESIMTADPKDPAVLEKIFNTLDSLDDKINKRLFGGANESLLAIPLGTMQVIVKSLKALVKGGMLLRDAIKKVAADNKVSEQDVISSLTIIDNMMNNVSEGLSEAELPGYDRMMGEVEGIIKKSKQRGVDDAKMRENVMSYVTGSKVYETATDVQREKLVRAVNKMFDVKEKSAPSVGRLFGNIKDVTKITMTEKSALVKQIKDLARGARDAKDAINKASNAVTVAVKQLASSGTITAKQAANVLRRFDKTNLLSQESIDRFTQYMANVFQKAEYADSLKTAKATKTELSSLSRNQDKNANLRDLAREFIKIDPSLVDDIDAYNDMASKIKESLKGSSILGKKVNFAEVVNIENATKYINDTMEAQKKTLERFASEEIQELMGVDPSDFTYEEMLSLLKKDEPITKYNESIIRDVISKMFGINSSIIKSMIRTGIDAFTGDPVDFSRSQVDAITRFMDMNLDRLSAKEALQAVDALSNFIQNNSTAKMESVLSDYQGKLNAETVLKKGIFAVPLRKLYSTGFGRLLAEQTTNLGSLFTRLFKGVQRGGLVEDYMGVTKLTNAKALAEKQANNIANDYVKQFYDRKANGEAFNTDFNNVERGMASFMLRNVIGTEEEMKQEFDRRKKLIGESIDVLREGNDFEKKKAELYNEVFDRILADSENIQDVKDRTDINNLEAIDFWIDQWADKYDEMADVSLNVYNKVLEKDLNYNPDKFVRLSRESGEVELANNESAFHNNNGTMYKKESSGLMTAVKPKSLPKNTKNGQVSRYIDLSFDKNNANSMYDALVDIKTAAAIRQIESFLNSSAFNKIINTPDDAKILKERIQLYVSNIRNKNPYSGVDELSKTIRRLNKVAAIGVGQALGSLAQPIKQVIPVAMNTLINAGTLDLGAIFNASKNNFISNSGYAIANRGVESQAQIESINKLIDQAAKSKGEKALKFIEEANKKWLDIFLVKPDVFIARASWMSYYEQSLKKQGINLSDINYDSHTVNEQAANYAQRMVDRQQNISDTDQAGKLFADKNEIKQVFVKMFMPFASFRMNQSTRLANDLSTLGHWSVSTKEDKIIAARSLAGFGVEMATFKLIAGALTVLLGTATKMMMGKEEDEEEKKKRVNNVIKGQLTGTVTDVFSPLPILDKSVQGITHYSLDKIQDLMGAQSDESKFNIYDVKKEDFIKSLGLFGIAADRANQLADLVYLSATGKFKNDYGKDKWISKKDQSTMAKLIGPAVMSNLGLAPSEVSGVIRMAISDAKKHSSIKEGGKTQDDDDMDVFKKEKSESNKEMKEETIDEKIKALNALKETANDDLVEEINNQIEYLSLSNKEKKELNDDSEKEKYKSLLGGYDNKSDLKRYEPSLYEKNFGKNSEYYKQHEDEIKVKKMMRDELRKEKDKEYNYSAPKKKKKW